jgi:single-stranded-DNA-specific exonuclease
MSLQSTHTWELPGNETTQAAAQLQRSLGLTAPVARLLVQRGYAQADSARRLLEAEHAELHDPFLMADMQRATERLVRAIRDGEHIVVSGDYDVDGVTGTTLLVTELRRLGAAPLDFFIPNRETDGYGISERLVRRAGEVGVRVLVSVDCGSSDHDTIRLARQAGIDVIVVDHHEIPELPSDAWAVLNPKRSDCGYPFKGLSAVGVAYKLLQALVGVLRDEVHPQDGLDLVALGTLADVQPVLDENRTMITRGLVRLGESARPGIRALKQLTGVAGERLKSAQVGFKLAPRLNAVGRVARAKLGVDLLLAESAPQAAALVQLVESQNDQRRLLQERVVQEATHLAEALGEQRPFAALVFAGDDWHPGVVGIAASRLVDRYGVPTALIGVQNGQGRGSVRTAGGVDVRAVLEEAADLLLKFGGHKQAAGFSIEPHQVPAFAKRFEEAVRRRRDVQAGRILHVDVELLSGELEGRLLDDLDRLEPFGEGNREPLFAVCGLRVAERTRIVGNGHLKLDLQFPDGTPLDAIAFGWGRSVQPQALVGGHVDLVGQVQRQDPRYGSGHQMIVRDMRSMQHAAI